MILEVHSLDCSKMGQEEVVTKTTVEVEITHLEGKL